MSNQRLRVWKTKPKGSFFRCDSGEVICADAIEMLDSLRDESVDIIFLDPPFNLGKKYGKKNKFSDKLSEEDYFRFMCSVLDRGCKVLSGGGSLFLYHIPRWGFKFAEYLNGRLDFQHWIAISMKNGFLRGPRLYPAHYSLLHFSKGKPSNLKRPKIPIQVCRHCGNDIKDYGGYRKYLSKGINLSDIWDDVSPVRHKNKKYRGPNEIPQLILKRILIMCGRKNKILVDPFAGAGTAPVMAKEFGMKFIACDREKEYFNLMVKRLKE